MTTKAFMYSFKIWVTSAFISPLLFGFIELVGDSGSYHGGLMSLYSYIFIWVVLGLFQFIFSVFTWAIFLLFIHCTIAFS